MWHWEAEFVADLHSSNEIYGRYIDDVFFTWNGPLSTLLTLLKNLNEKHRNITFIHQIDSTVSFLDVLIQNDNGVLVTSVYRKDAAEPYVVPSSSDHPLHISRNTINVAMKRAIRYSSTFEAFNRERRYIRLKLLYNGYSSNYIDAQFRKFFVKHSIQVAQSLRPLMGTSCEYFLLRDRLLYNYNVSSGSKSFKTISVTVDANRPNRVSVKKLWIERDARNPASLIIHLPYEKRLRSLPKKIHHAWSTVFQNTNVEQNRLIIGTTIRKNIKLELAQARPLLATLTLPQPNTT